MEACLTSVTSASAWTTARRRKRACAVRTTGHLRLVLRESVPGFSETLVHCAHQSSAAGAQPDRTSTTIMLMVSANALLLVTGSVE
jgi:hypothetical protein